MVRMTFDLETNEEFLNWHFKFHIEMSVSGYCNYLGQFARQSSSFIKIIYRKNFQPRRPNHHLGFINIGSQQFSLYSTVVKLFSQKKTLYWNNALAIIQSKLDGNMCFFGYFYYLGELH